MFGAAAALLVLLCTDASAQSTDLDRLQGNWVVVQAMDSGSTMPKDTRYVFAGNRLTISDPGSKVVREFRIALDPASSPRHIDLVPLRGEFKGLLCQGIYRLTGDRLTLCTPNGPRTQRPTEFVSRPGGNTILATLRRAGSAQGR